MYRASIHYNGETRKMCRNSSWQQLRPMLHLTRGCPLILHPSPPFSFLFSHFFFLSSLRQLRVVLHLPWGCPSPQFTLPPFLTRSKEVSGVTVSTACRLSVPPSPPPKIQKALPSLSRLRRSPIPSCLSGKGDTL